MSHLPRLERLLLTFWVAVWLLCFTLALKSAIQGLVVPHLYVVAADGPQGYPALAGHLGWSSDLAPLHLGDRLIRIDEIDLRGMGPLELYARTAEAAANHPTVQVLFNRDGNLGHADLTFRSYSRAIWLRLPGSFVFALAAVVLLLRAAPSRMIRVSFQFLICMAIGDVSNFGGTLLQTAASMLIHTLYIALFVPLAILTALLFPEDRMPTRLAAWPWFFLLGAPLHASGDFGVLMPPEVGILLYQVRDITAAALIVLIITINYRRTDVIGRRRIRWVLFGVYCACLPPLAITALAAVDPRFSDAWDLSSLAYASLPVCTLIAIVRYNLFDIDRLITATASYNVILVLVVGAGLVFVPQTAEALSDLIGVAPPAGQALLSLLLAAVVVPAHRRLHPRIERLFFPERAAVHQGMEELSLEISKCETPRDLILCAGRGLHQLLRPEVCVVYGQSEDSYVPVFVKGGAVPPAFDAARPLIGILARHRRPLALEDLGRRGMPELGAFDLAVLEGAGAEVVIPIFRRDDLFAFVGLGAKHSGDVYTQADLTLFAALGERVSMEIRRFEDARLLREARAMQLALRRYVPGAVVDELERGRGIEQGEREVSVLFVDIRGYTTLSEGKRADEIFSTVSRYTECVSQVVLKHGGSVVEFSGDGMMAVFGAPKPLTDKELAAVRSGREIVDTVGALPPGVSGGSEHLSVGVGIATGPAFVGNIRAADRVIWSAIGNTTNLAARLQSLSRDLEAAMVIDPITWERARAATTGFELLEKVPIRGRAKRENLYVLPLGPRSVA